VKIKCLQRGTFVIVGFVPSSGGQISKLRVAQREGQALYYAGRAGGGLSVKVAQDLRRRLEKIKRKTSPLTKKIRKPDTVWVEPLLMANIQYTEITADDCLRHPSSRVWSIPNEVATTEHFSTLPLLCVVECLGARWKIELFTPPFVGFFNRVRL